MEYKTPPLEKENEGNNHKFADTMPDIQLMCVDKEKLLQLCELFPQTAENIKQRARERRIRFMEQKNMNSIWYDKECEKIREDVQKEYSNDAQYDDKKREDIISQKIELIKTTFYTDEEPESLATNKEDMKLFLNKMNQRIDNLVEALKDADNQICKQTDSKPLLQQIKEKKKLKKEHPSQVPSAYQNFKDKIKEKNQP
jgi:hypothetical protein